MSLSAREEHELESIEESLCGCDPGLASMLATFARLTADEEMPVRERIQASWRRAGGRKRGRWRRRPGQKSQRADWQRIGWSLCVLIAFGLIAGALTAVAGAGGRDCTVPPAMCAGPAPAHPPAHAPRSATAP
jgi:hypothetical protein